MAKSYLKLDIKWNSPPNLTSYSVWVLNLEPEATEEFVRTIVTRAIHNLPDIETIKQMAQLEKIRFVIFFKQRN